MLRSALASCTLLAACALPRAHGPDVARFFAEFEAALGEDAGDPRAFLALAHEWTWPTYSWPDDALAGICAYLRDGPDGPGKGLAALAVIGYRDPAAALVLLEVAMSDRASVGTRGICLNAAPCVLGIGDLWILGESSASDAPSSETPATEEEKTFAERLGGFAAEAADVGASRMLARRVSELAEHLEREPNEIVRIALWHASAWLLGQLDPADRGRLAPLLDADDDGRWGNNLAYAVALALNRDFVREALDAAPELGRSELARVVRAAARAAWDAAPAAQPDARALLSGFGIELEADEPLDGPRVLARLRTAIDDPSEVKRFNAYRILNEIAGAHYDLDFVFLLDKYAGNPIASGMRAREREQLLRRHFGRWLDRRSARS